jgi:hypothetical protein
MENKGEKIPASDINHYVKGYLHRGMAITNVQMKKTSEMLLH